ncbi:MAG TPA: glycosyltransferase [Azospirillum sp.]|nr:glycosyltransferase [Azospirillum sp.]
MGGHPSGSLRVALLNPFVADSPFAERELSLRMLAALRAKRWEAAIVQRAAEIEAFDPDLVVSLHPQVTPKLTRHFTVACDWNPPKFHDSHPVFHRNERSYDGLLTAGEGMRRRMADLFWPTARPLLTAPMYPSSPAIALEPTLGPDSRLFYVGSNWDGRRYPLILGLLAAAGVLALHGRRDRWEHMAHAFTGEVPFDGRSVIERANACGLGLCLHLPAHAEAGIPNMRIFELSAAGALSIADRHPFIMNAFGDSVLYVDLTAGEHEVAEQILANVAWARANPARGRAMAREAQAIFLERFSLEVLFTPFPDLVAEARATLSLVPAASGAPPVPVDLVLPVEPGGWEDAVQRMEAVAAQTAGPVGVVLAMPDDVPGNPPEGLVRRLGDVRVVRVPAGVPSGSCLWAGLRAATAEWVGIVPPGARPFPNHVAVLLAAAAELGVDAVHGGALQPMLPEETLELYQAETRPTTIGLDALDATTPMATAATLHPATLLVRRTRLRPILRRDPELGDAAAAFLAHRIAAEGPLGCSGLLTVHAATRADAGLAAELGRLRRLSALTTRPTPAGAAPAAPPPALPAASFSDLNPELAERLPHLSGPAGFAVLPGDRPVYLYGASRGGRIVQLELAKWEHLSLAGFLDGLRTGEAWGLPVTPPEAVAEALRNATVIIASQYVSEIARRLSALGVTDPYNAYPFIAQHIQVKIQSTPRPTSNLTA